MVHLPPKGTNGSSVVSILTFVLNITFEKEEKRYFKFAKYENGKKNLTAKHAIPVPTSRQQI